MDDNLKNVNGDARNHNVKVSITLNPNDYEAISAVLPAKVHADLETRRELAVMHEVLKHEGKTMIDKIDNTIEEWESETTFEVQPSTDYYKLLYRY